MILMGAGGHAKELMDILSVQYPDDAVRYYVDKGFNLNSQPSVIEGKEQLVDQIGQENCFLAIANPLLKKSFFALVMSLRPESLLPVIAPTALVSPEVELGKGLNIMHYTMISAGAKLGNGVLINAFGSVHHEASVGDFCEVAPGARILGNVSIGSCSRIGANATILPGVVIGEGVTVGAGSVVTKDVNDDLTVVGVPAAKQ